MAASGRSLPAAHQASKILLDGERFSAPTAVLTPSAGCGLQQFGTVDFQASGVATGPFPGTFTETGQWDFDLTWEQTFQTSFTITSGSKVISGSVLYDNTATDASGKSLVNNWGGCDWSQAGGAYTTCSQQVLTGGCAGQAVAFISANGLSQVFEHPTGNYRMTVTGGNNQAAPVNSEFGLPLGVEVTDSLGAPVGGVTVAFVPAKRNPTASPQGPWTTTAWDGTASMNMFASPVAGTYTVSAKGTKGAKAVFTLTNSP